MIVFDLACPAGHVFEAWFASTPDFESQRKRGFVACPICGSGEVEKAVMSPRVAAKGNRQELSTAPRNNLSSERGKAFVKALAEAQAKLLENSDYVGDRFAETARAIHVGEIEGRSIHGITTSEEACSLIEDGIGIAPLPFPVRPPGADH